MTTIMDEVRDKSTCIFGRDSQVTFSSRELHNLPRCSYTIEGLHGEACRVFDRVYDLRRRRLAPICTRRATSAAVCPRPENSDRRRLYEADQGIHNRAVFQLAARRIPAGVE